MPRQGDAVADSGEGVVLLSVYLGGMCTAVVGGLRLASRWQWRWLVMLTAGGLLAGAAAVLNVALPHLVLTGQLGQRYGVTPVGALPHPGGHPMLVTLRLRDGSLARCGLSGSDATPIVRCAGGELPRLQP